MSLRLVLVMALVSIVCLFLTPVLIPLVLASGDDHDGELGGVPSGVAGCSMYCAEAPVSMPMLAPAVSGCSMFCKEVK